MIELLAIIGGSVCITLIVVALVGGGLRAINYIRSLEP